MRRILQQLSISQKLTTFNLILGVTLISVGGALLFWQNHRMMQHALEQRVGQHGKMVSDNLVLPVEFEDWKRAATIMEAFAKDPAIARAELRGVSDELIVSYYGPEPEGEAPVGESMLHHQSIAIVDTFGLEIAWLEIYASRAEVMAAAREMLVTITGILSLSVVLGLLISHRSQRMVTQPLARLTDLVRRVRATENYRLRAEPLYPDDIGRLTEGVNAMLDIIQRRDVNLARTVELRTRELAAKNARLEREVRQRERADRKAQSNQAKFENAFHNAPVGMALIVGDGALIKRNAMFDTLLDTTGEGSLNLMPLIEAEAREDLHEQLQQLVIGGINEFSCDAPFHTGDGRELTCALHFSAVREDDDFSYAVLQLQDATESRRLAAELAHQARHDTLTGLANRRAFEQALSELASASAMISYPVVIGLIDLDKFKPINDQYGHMAGDTVLCEIVRRMSDVLHPNMTL
ncbi:MAG: diguanylate cyclase, partial [Pseudomonadota bacterium]